MNPLVLSNIINLFLEIFADFNFTQTSPLRIDVAFSEYYAFITY